MPVFSECARNVEAQAFIVSTLSRDELATDQNAEDDSSQTVVPSDPPLAMTSCAGAEPVMDSATSPVE